MSHADDIFYRQFGFVLVLLIVFTLMAGVLANSIGGDALFRISQSQDAVLDRIKPIGSVETAVAAPKVEVATAAKATAKTPKAAAPAAPKPAVAAAPAPAPAAAKTRHGGRRCRFRVLLSAIMGWPLTAGRNVVVELRARRMVFGLVSGGFD